MSAVAQLVLRHPADGTPEDQAVPDNSSRARFEGEVEMLSARPPPTHRPGTMFLHVGLFMLMRVFVSKCYGEY